jgi:NAD(P)-dependent dehydrogenase (short-subunit alcohol dehydrogenase family)
LEGADRGVTCTSVSPTWVETEMLRNSVEKMASRSGQTLDAQRAEITASNPQNRLVQPQEIAELVSFLCSDLSPALTMEDVQVNAGAHW